MPQKLNKAGNMQNYVPAGNYEFAYLKGNDNYDVPVLVKDKKTNKIKGEIVPPFTNSDGEKVIWERDKDNKNEDNKIKKFLEDNNGH